MGSERYECAWLNKGMTKISSTGADNVEEKSSGGGCEGKEAGVGGRK